MRCRHHTPLCPEPPVPEAHPPLPLAPLCPAPLCFSKGQAHPRPRAFAQLCSLLRFPCLGASQSMPPSSFVHSFIQESFLWVLCQRSILQAQGLEGYSSGGTGHTQEDCSLRQGNNRREAGGRTRVGARACWAGPVCLWMVGGCPEQDNTLDAVRLKRVKPPGSWLVT